MHYPRILLNLLTLVRFQGSSRYWEWRYRTGGNSGQGSYGAEAEYKSAILNRCFAEHHIQTVIDFGCGDGNQLKTLLMPSYLGYDVSPTAIARCRSMFADDSSKQFRTIDQYAGETAEAAFSLDVLYHLVEDEVFDAYLARLFGAAERLVIIYAVDAEETRILRGRHVRYRKFTPLIAERFPEFTLISTPQMPAYAHASFFVFARNK
jgi:hypothetical protein